MKARPDSLVQLKSGRAIRIGVSEFGNFFVTLPGLNAFKVRLCVQAYKTIAVVLALIIKYHRLTYFFFHKIFYHLQSFIL